jgi:hypothetical protein
MNDSGAERSSNSHFIAVILLFLSATGFLIEPITSARPNDPELIKSKKTSISQTESRLWQDPIALIENHQHTLTGNEIRIHSTNLGLRPEELSKYKKFSIFAVSVSGSTYPETAETRRRTRYAVTSTLDAANFYPRDPETMGIYKLGFCSNTGQSTNIGFEWFDRDNPPPTKGETALVLWLNEDQIKKSSGDYRNFIDCLITEINNELSNQSARTNVSSSEGLAFNFFLVGPSRTPLLIELLKADPIPHKNFLAISYIATASDEEILKKLGADGCINSREKWYCQSPFKSDEKEDEKEKLKIKLEELSKLYDSRYIIRSVGTDDKLVSALLIELWERGFNNREYQDFLSWIFQSKSSDTCDDGLVLIHELDTFYAYALTSHFKEDVFWESCNNNKNQSLPIRRYSYLRGLDGHLPSIEKTTNEEIVNNNTARKGKNIFAQWDDAPPEHAEGRNQYDYLRRLVTSIEELDRDKSFSKNGVKAIGIFGSDVYDKLIVLQALREQFKNKIFFTTDLDARFLHNEQLAWSRNLIVASNFGLVSDLTPACKEDGKSNCMASWWDKDPNMPFRDSYQTSIAVSIFSILDQYSNENKNVTDKRESLKNSLINQRTPKIFEIGQTKANLLKSENQGSKETHKTDNPEIQGIWHLLILIAFLGIMWVAVIVPKKLTALPFTHNSSNSFSNQNNWGWKENTLYLIVSLIAITLFCISVLEDDFEPFMWLEGISVWPNLAIRAAGILITCYFASRFYVTLKHNKEIFSKKYFELVDRPRSNDDSASLTDNIRSIDDIWKHYFEATSPAKLHGYMLLFTAIAVSMTLFILNLDYFGQINFPYRGRPVLYLHQGLLLLQFLLLWVVVFWFCFEGMACINLINAVNGNDYKWLVNVLNEFATETGISKKYLDRYAQFQIIAQLTEHVIRLIYLPFGMILLILLGRSKIFDQLGIPVSLILIFLTMTVMLLYVMHKLKASANKLRENVLKSYESEKRKIEFSEEKNEIAIKQINYAIELVRNTQRGIYASFSHQPIMTAILLPFGGMGGVQIIEYLFGIH